MKTQLPFLQVPLLTSKPHLDNLPLDTDSVKHISLAPNHSKTQQQPLKFTKPSVTFTSALNSILVSASLTQNVPTGKPSWKPSKCKMIKKNPHTAWKNPKGLVSENIWQQEIGKKKNHKGLTEESSERWSFRGMLLMLQEGFHYSSFSSPSSTSFRLSTSSVPFPLVSLRISSSISLKQPGSIRHT